MIGGIEIDCKLKPEDIQSIVFELNDPPAFSFPQCPKCGAPADSSTSAKNRGPGRSKKARDAYMNESTGSVGNGDKRNMITL